MFFNWSASVDGKTRAIQHAGQAYGSHAIVPGVQLTQLGSILHCVSEGFWSDRITNTLQDRDTELCRLLKPHASQPSVALTTDTHAEWAFPSALMPLLKYNWYTKQCLTLVACS